MEVVSPTLCCIGPFSLVWALGRNLRRQSTRSKTLETHCQKSLDVRGMWKAQVHQDSHLPTEAWTLSEPWMSSRF